MNMLVEAVLFASMLAQADYDHLNVGDQVTLDVSITARIDFAKPIQWREYDLTCWQKAPSQLLCVVVGKREPT
jgi:hypothetical protein